MERIVGFFLAGRNTVIDSAFRVLTAIAVIFCMGASAGASELRPYNLPSQKMENSGLYQQRAVTREKVDESFYRKFAADSKKYDANKKLKTTVMLNDKLKKSSTDAERAHYNRLLDILSGN